MKNSTSLCLLIGLSSENPTPVIITDFVSIIQLSLRSPHDTDEAKMNTKMNYNM